MIIAGNSNVDCFTKGDLRLSADEERVAINWVGALTIEHFHNGHPSAHKLRELFKAEKGWKFLSIGVHDIINLCHWASVGKLDGAFPKVFEMYSGIFSELHALGKFAWMIFPQAVEQFSYPNLTSQHVAEIARLFNKYLENWCAENGVSVINPLSRICGEDSRPLPQYLQADGIHLNAEGAQFYLNEIEALTGQHVELVQQVHPFEPASELESFCSLILNNVEMPWEALPAISDFRQVLSAFAIELLSKRGLDVAVDSETDLVSSGLLDSLNLVELYTFASQTMQIDIPFDVNLLELNTVGKIIAFLFDKRKQRAAVAGNWEIGQKDFVLSLRGNFADVAQQREMLEAEERIGKMSPELFRAFEENLSVAGDGLACPYGIVFFWMALYQAVQGKYFAAMELLKLASDPGKRFCFRDPRIEYYGAIWSKLDTIALEGAGVASIRGTAGYPKEFVWNEQVDESILTIVDHRVYSNVGVGQGKVQAGESALHTPVARNVAFRESHLAHQWLDGLQGLEVGPSAHNPFGLRSRFVGLQHEGYEKEQIDLAGEFVRLDIVSRAEDIPVVDESEDYVLSSHVIEHCPDLIKTLVEWFRIVKVGGYIFMIVPHRNAAPVDVGRPLTEWRHVVDDYVNRITEESHEDVSMYGGGFGYCHYHVFDFDLMQDFIGRIFGDRLQLVDAQPVDDKIGNGFTLVYRKNKSLAECFPWFLDEGIEIDVFSKQFPAVSAIEPVEHVGIPIVVVANLVPFKNPEQLQRQDLCIASLCDLKGQGVIPLNICYRDELLTPNGWEVEPALENNARDALGVNDKRKPFVSELFQIAASWCHEHGVEYFALTNSDIIFTPRLISEFNRLIEEGYDAVAVSRNEVERIDPVAGLVPGYLEVNGYDVFLCRAEWWNQNRSRFQPYIFGARAWDDAYAATMACHGKFHVLNVDGMCFHIKHPTEWLGGPYAEFNLFLYNGVDKKYQDRYNSFIKEILRTDKNCLGGSMPALLEKHFNLACAEYLTPQEKSALRYVNIGMITYNRLGFTKQCIDSFLRHTDYPYVLTVVDNCSQDGTREYLKELKAKGIIDNLVLLDVNVGVAKASNLAWSLEPHASYYLKLDNDIVFQKPRWLANLVAVADHVPEVGVVGYNFEPISYPLHNFRGINVRVKPVGNIGGACILVPRRTYELLGNWCEDYGLYGEEDADYGVRIQLAGLMNAYMEDEDIGFHLPGGKAAAINPKTFEAIGGGEDQTDAEYRLWKDDMRRKNVMGNGKFSRNFEEYKAGKKSLHVSSTFAPWILDYRNKNAIQGDPDIWHASSYAALAEVDGERKLRCVVYTLDFPTAACATIRLVDPLSKLASQLEFIWGVNKLRENPRVTGEQTLEFNLDILDQVDFIIVQRMMPMKQFKHVLTRILDSGKPVIYETDDLLHGLPLDNPHAEYSLKNRDLLLDFIPRCHAVTVSTEELKRVYSEMNSHIYVLPNYLNDEKWSFQRDGSVGHADRVVIGFAGTFTHMQDLALVEQALERIAAKYADKVVFKFIGCATPRMLQLPNSVVLDFVVNYSNYPRLLKNAGFDVAVAPLLSNEFNNCKSNLKWLEYSACGMAGVYSNLPPYQSSVAHMETGILADNDPESWFQALDYLVGNHEARRSMANTARETVRQNYFLSLNASRYLQVYRQVIAANPAKEKTRDDLAKQEKQAKDEELYENAYQTWIKKHTLQEIDAQLFAERMLLKWHTKPVFHFVMHLNFGEERLLADTIDALGAQMYTAWRFTVVADSPPSDALLHELPSLKWLQREVGQSIVDVIERTVSDGDGDWVALIQPGLQLAPHLFLALGDYINIRPNWKMIYTDEDVIDSIGWRSSPKFKPDFNLDLLRSMPYFGALYVVERGALMACGGYGDLSGAQNYDLSLRILDQFGESAIGHIADVLCHVPAAAPVILDEANGLIALERHLQRRGIKGKAMPGMLPETFRMIYHSTTQPLVSIIVPTRDKYEYLRPCVDSLLEKTAYRNFELIIVDNQSADPDMFDYYEQLLMAYPERIKILHYDQAFNFAAICNFGAEQAAGEYLLFLNNDTRVIQPEWLERMVSHGLRDEVGIVGARLIYPETSRIQHAGVILGFNVVADHVFNDQIDFTDPGYMGRAQAEQDFSSVTAACMLVQKSVYAEVGGMDEEGLAVSYNDVDLCLKVGERGYKIVWTPYASLVHDTHSTLKDVKKDPEQAALSIVLGKRERELMLRRWLPRLAEDAAYNRHLSLAANDCRVEQDVVVDWDVNFHDRPRIIGVPLPGGSGEYRMISPFRALSDNGLAQTNIVLGPKMATTRVMTPVELERTHADTLVLHAPIDDMQLAALEEYKKYNSPLRIFTLDDLITNPPQKSSFFKLSFRDAKSRLRKALSLSDRMIVSTQPLADLCQSMIQDIRILPNMLERRQWGGLSSKRRQGKRPRVGWAGAQQHQGDLELFIDVVKATAAEVDWVFFGMCLDELKPYVKEIYEFQLSYQDYLARLASLNLDLAVSPLEINAFNEAKSNLRLLEYGYLGWPVICTDIYPYQNAPVKRVENKAEAWIEAILERTHDLDGAEREGDCLREWVLQNYILEDHLDEWLAALVR